MAQNGNTLHSQIRANGLQIIGEHFEAKLARIAARSPSATQIDEDHSEKIIQSSRHHALVGLRADRA